MVRRFLAVAAAMALMLALVPGRPVQAAGSADPAIYHTIVANTAYAEFSSSSGCYQTNVWISSTQAMYAAQPGPLNKQGLSAVAIVISDTCAPPVGKGYPAVFDGDGQTFDPLTIAPRLETASIAATIPVWDRVSDRTLDVSISIGWVRTSPLDHSTVRNHVRFPWAGNVMANDNNLMAEAIATGSVLLDGMDLLAGPSGFAMLQQVKSTCREIRFPHYTGDSDWCF